MTPLRSDPAPETAPDRRRVRTRTLLAAVVLVAATMGLAGLGAAPASGAPRQDPGAATTLDPTATSSGSGLTTTTVAGTPTTSAVTPTTSAVTPTTAAAAGPDANRVADENRKIWLVVGGLVAVALALLLLTIRYWRQTKPVPVVATPAADEPAATPGRRARRGERGRHSRRAVAGADHAAADEGWEPRGTGEHERIDVSSTTASHRPTAEQRAAAYAAVTRQR